LSGHGFDAADEVVLGASTLAELNKRVGDTVDVRYSATTPTTRERIVGTITMPTVGGGLHPSMGTGAWLDEQLIPVAVRNPFSGQPATAGPNAIFVRLHAGVNKAKAAKTFEQLVGSLPSSNSFGIQVDLVPVQRPAEIVIYRSMSSTLLILGGGLAVGAMAALALTLVASVRRRQRDLAMFKALGLAPRQLASVVAWQSSIAIAIGTLVGVPVGIIVGRTLWRLFANALHAVPQPTVPTATIALIAVGALILANLVAAIPGTIASRTPTATLLRAE
jgi:ABC-type lipoprotein release transport system permease subunit